MDTRDLEYVVGVRQAGSIGKAAEALGISQPALTKAVRRVEEQLGLQLFERVPQGMRPTQAGELFLERAQKLRRDYDDAMAEMRSLLTGEQGMVRIGYSLTFPDELLHTACKRLLRERPAAKLKLCCRMAQELLSALRAGDLDIVFVPIQASEPDLDIQPLYQDRLVVAADAGHPLCSREKLRLDDLVGEDWALPAGHITVRIMLDEAFRRRGLPPPSTRVEADFSSPNAYQLIVGSRMLTLARFSREFLDTGMAALDLAPGEMDLDRHIGMVTRTNGFLSPVCCRAIELFQEEISKGNFGLGVMYPD
ncbi:LysR family transcriptional regulator [Metapseudomonas lalkuanensis]|uniref:LysR family transcriptional regulator n=1 Tax=Metapseudomonas lalkuanensis TaxID=2604832 RepID=A0A5J6QM91_9GAMM|nr:LysR family transcriptional regulator [Pseudomonas lalkuanensis]QEY62895.1 LysR family transcriptional regulator [Pseudomonas lalkuanensis]